MVEDDLGVVHLDAEMPAAETGPEVLEAGAAVRVLLHVDPADVAATRVLQGHDGAPAVGAGKLALGGVRVGGQGRLDEGSVEADELGPAGSERESRDERDGLEGGLEEGELAGMGLVGGRGSGAGIVWVDFDRGGAIRVGCPVKPGEMLGHVPIWKKGRRCERV